MNSSAFDSLGYGLTLPGDAGGRHGHALAHLSTADVVGIAVAVVVAVVVGGIVVYCCCVRKRKPRATAAPPLAGILVLPGAGTAPMWSSAAAGRDAPGPSSGAVVGAGCRLCRAGYGVEVAVSLECGHRFHRRCIRRWLQLNLACPICNATHIAFLGGSSSRKFRVRLDIGEHAPRISLDDSASRDDGLVEIKRCHSSRF